MSTSTAHIPPPKPMKSELYHPHLRDDETEEEKLIEVSVSEMDIVLIHVLSRNRCCYSIDSQL